ncbi:MAG: esterase/lipase family protein [Steroidobacteraceae bacterium]
MTRETVVYVHGLWSSRADSLLLRRRLAGELGFNVEAFRYPTVAGSMADVTARLADFVAGLAPSRLHLVGHSLGGLVIYRFLERFPDQAPGGVVFLGTPAVASRFAQGVARWNWAAPALGKCVAEELLVDRERCWTAPRPLGIIAGTRPLGLGPVLARWEDARRQRSGARDAADAWSASDGTVAVSETRLPGATDHITVAASHMGLLISARVARETASFLRNGHFALSSSRPPPSPRFTSARSS